MARPITRTVSSQAASTPVALNNLSPSPFNVSLLLDVTGTLTASVEYTLDNVFAEGYAPASGVWNAVASMGSLTADTAGSLAYPVTAVRLNVTAFTSGSATLTVLQQT